MMPPPRRKKWTEAEERTLIDKYGEMVCDGSLSKMKTREKKYKPIALHVNSIHHDGDPIVYPWEWSWKDVSNKVQNMRHQYSLVKQKIKQPESGDPVGNCGDGFDWVEGLTHWSNFLRYKEVFGDVTLPFGNGFDEIVEFGNIGQSGGSDFQNGVIGLEFDYDGNGNETENGNRNHDYTEIETRRKRKAEKNLEKKAWGFVANQLAQLREMEARFEQREEERERERQRRESIRVKNEEERENVLERLNERMENEREEFRKRRDDELIQERKREERMNRRRIEWNLRIDEMVSEHRVEMAQIQGRILDEKQNVMNQLLGIVSISGNPSGITDNTNANGHYLSQMMQHVGGMVDGDTRHNQEDDQFIGDG